MPSDEVEHQAIEDRRLFPMHRMSGLGYHGGFVVGNIPGEQS